MKKFAFLSTLLVLVACGDDDSRADGGTSDTITLMDAPTRQDAVLPPGDATTTPDATVTQGCSINQQTGFLEGSTCFPRCAPATTNAFLPAANGGTCPEADDPATPDVDERTDCVLAAIAGDSAAPVDVTGIGPVNCETCFNVQQLGCQNQACPTEFQAFSACAQGCQGNADVDACLMAMCATQQNAFVMCVNTKIEAGDAALTSCFQNQVTMSCLTAPQ